MPIRNVSYSKKIVIEEKVHFQRSLVILCVLRSQDNKGQHYVLANPFPTRHSQPQKKIENAIKNKL